MPSYLVEVYMPRSSGDDPNRVADLLRRAADALSTPEAPTRWVRTTFLPGDETCFHVLEAETLETVEDLCERAMLSSPRIVPVIEAGEPRRSRPSPA